MSYSLKKSSRKDLMIQNASALITSNLEIRYKGIHSYDSLCIKPIKKSKSDVLI